MDSDNVTVLVMAAGTGGHVFPALSIAEVLASHSINVEWLGTRHGMENELLAGTDFKLHQISVKGLRGSSLSRKLMAPFMLFGAFMQSMVVIRRAKPNCILGMGGFVCGPAGIAAKLMGKPLLVHEQNAVAGLTNKCLSRIADRVFEAFPGTFQPGKKVRHTGNPLRQDIVKLHHLGSSNRQLAQSAPLHILVLGGSQGAAAINEAIPEVLAQLSESNTPQVFHQTGSATFQKTRQQYQSLGLQLDEACRVVPFIDDMAAAYGWADLVICRSGASTVSEIAAAGRASILIPYPHHKDQQQTLNAQWLSQEHAAYLLQQAELSAQSLLEIIRDLQGNRAKLLGLSQRAAALAICDASEVIAEECLEYANAGR